MSPYREMDAEVGKCELCNECISKREIEDGSCVEDGEGGLWHSECLQEYSGE